MAKRKMEQKTVSLECKCCEANFLAVPETKEFERKICYRCHLSGLADHYLDDESVEETSDIQPNKSSSKIGGK